MFFAIFPPEHVGTHLARQGVIDGGDNSSFQDRLPDESID